ncbi:MAG: acyltransferase [Minwuiales bacterium]|nr:acyltransferase [Minwuiales bacterium]
MKMRFDTVVRRFLLPAPLITLLYALKYRCLISPKAEVEYHPNLKIGRGTKVSSFTKIKAAEGPFSLGANVSIGTGCVISSHRAGLEIGDDTMISANTAIIASSYRYERSGVPMQYQETTAKGIRIGKDVWIGVNCAILDGADIGDGAIITPNSVVSAKIPPYAIASGNPAKVIFYRR